MSTTLRSVAVPTAVPDLRRGMHLAPGDGACLMEYVSVLAGERFSDAPPCTDPLVAVVARMVNDAVSADARPGLARFAPALATIRPMSPDDECATLLAVLAAAATLSGGSARVARHHRRALRRSERLSRRSPASPWARADAVMWRRGRAWHGLEAAVRAVSVLPGTGRDAALVALLNAAVKSRPVRRPGAAVTSTPTTLMRITA